MREVHVAMYISRRLYQWCREWIKVIILKLCWWWKDCVCLRHLRLYGESWKCGFADPKFRGPIFCIPGMSMMREMYVHKGFASGMKVFFWFQGRGGGGCMYLLTSKHTSVYPRRPGLPSEDWIRTLVPCILHIISSGLSNIYVFTIPSYHPKMLVMCIGLPCKLRISSIVHTTIRVHRRHHIPRFPIFIINQNFIVICAHAQP